MAKQTKYLIIICLFSPILFFNLKSFVNGENYHVLLASSLLHGKFSIAVSQNYYWDLAVFDGQYFWPVGISPALIMMPFVKIAGTNFQEIYLKLPLTILNFILLFKIAKLLKLPSNKSIVFAAFFIFGSVYTPVATIAYSTYFTQVVEVTFTLMAIYLFFIKKSWLLVGLALALAVLARTTAMPAALFFLISLAKKPIKLNNLLQFLTPIVLAVMFLAIYNYARFGNLFEQGYSYQTNPEEAVKRRAHGLFSKGHIGANLYYLIVKTPDLLLDNSHNLKFPYLVYDPYGMSIFFLSPMLFLIFKANFKKPLVKSSLLTTLVILIPILTYYGIGHRQIGYRYALDFYPFLLIILSQAARKVHINYLKILTAAGIAFTWFFIFQALILRL